MTFKKSPKNILALALLLISGYAFSDSEYFYNELEDGVEITGCDGDCYLLPEHIDGKSVIGISDTAFFANIFIGTGFVLTWNSGYDIPIDYLDNTYRPSPNDIFDNNNRPIPIQEYPIQHEHYTVPSIKIPPGYQYIGTNFFHSNSLKNVSLNEGLQAIGRDAFAGNGIRDIVIPDSVSEISSGAFSDNPLSHIIFLGNRPTIGRAAFLTHHGWASCLLAAREDSLDASIECSLVTERLCVSKDFTEDLPIPVIGLEPQGCEYRDDAIFSSQEGWGPINPPDAVADQLLESYLDGYFDAIPDSALSGIASK